MNPGHTVLFMPTPSPPQYIVQPSVRIKGLSTQIKTQRQHI